MSDTLSIVVRGEELILHPERAVFWPRTKSLIVADIHFGKSGHFGRHGIAVPDGADAEDRSRLSGLIREWGATRVIVLGDLLHAPRSYDTTAEEELESWLRGIDGVELHVVAGNHDRGVSRSRVPSIHWWEEGWNEGPFRFMHDAQARRADERERCFCLSGHIHPVVRLGGVGKHRLRVPVFWQISCGLVLPAFGVFTGGYAVQADAGDRLFAAGMGVVRELRTVTARGLPRP